MFMQLLIYYYDLIKKEKYSKNARWMTFLIVFSIAVLIIGTILSVSNCMIGMNIMYLLAFCSIIVMIFKSESIPKKIITPKDYHEKILMQLKKTLDEAQIKNKESLQAIIEQCRDYEQIETNNGWNKFIDIFNLMICPLVITSGSIIFSMVNKKESLLILGGMIVIVLLFILVTGWILPEIKSWLNSYKTVAKKMRGDLEIILSEYYNDK